MSSSLVNLTIMSVVIAAGSWFFGDEVSRVPDAFARETSISFHELTASLSEIPEDLSDARDEVVSKWETFSTRFVSETKELRVQVAAHRLR